MTSYIAAEQDGGTNAKLKQGVLANAKNSVSSSQKPNPIWKYMGFGENFRPRLPSRNWMIFLSIIGTFSAVVIYDKREKKRNQMKWCKLVEHISKQPLDSHEMPRKISIFLEAPPMDGLRSAQDHFKEFVKPILVSSGLDWEFIQGRKEGDIRTEVVDRIRNSRLSIERRAEKDCILRFRMNNKVKNFEGYGGDIVIGRHTWKEYVQGLHEGWLAAMPEISDEATKSLNESKETSSLASSSENHGDESESSSSHTKPVESLKTSSTPYFNILQYLTLPEPSDFPNELEPSVTISFPHLIGFFNTPKRLYRFLNRRKLADNIGRETAAAILASYRPYYNSAEQKLSEFSAEDNSPQTYNAEDNTSSLSEQQVALQDEEKDWHKSVFTQEDEQHKRLWSSPLVLDQRIATRMRRFELTPEEEEKANKIEVLEEEIEGWIKGSMRMLWRFGKAYLQ